MDNHKLIFCFFKHPQLGLSIDSFMVKLLDENTLSYQYNRIVHERMGDYEYPFAEEDKKILKIIGELNQRNIDKLFNRKQIKWETFLEKAKADKDLNKAISGYFDRRISACLELLRGRTIHWKERISDHPGMQGYHVMSNPAKVTYHFHREKDHIRYYLSVNFNGRSIDLFRKGTEILCQDPCWILHNGCIYSFDDGTDGNKIKPFLLKREIVIPDRLSDQYLESFMVKTSRRFDVRFSGFAVREVPDRISSHVSLAKDLEGLPVIQLHFCYDHFMVTPAQTQHLLVQFRKNEEESILLRYPRDSAMERERASSLLTLGLTELKPSWYTLQDTTQDAGKLLEWLIENKQNLLNHHIELKLEWDKKIYTDEVPVIETLEFKQANDWFDIHAIMKIGQYEIPFIRLKRHILEGNRNFILPEGTYALLPEQWFTNFADLFEFADSSDDFIRIQRQHHGILTGHPILHGDLVRTLPDKQKLIYTDDIIPEYEVPSRLNATLRDYQKKGFSWLCRLDEKGLGACLADDMGLGKTIQIIAFILKKQELHHAHFSENPGDKKQGAGQLDLFSFSESISGSNANRKPPSLIVMAPSLIHNWENELGKFAPGLDIIIYAGQRRSILQERIKTSDVVLTTYGVIRNDIDWLKDICFSNIVLDESQLIKNMRSITFQRIRLLQGQQKIVLTGTPVENSLSDLWAQITFIQPGLLGSYTHFRKEFQIPIEQQQNTRQLNKLRRLINPFILRRTKNEVAPELPILTNSVRYCEMDEEQRDFYEKQKSVFRNSILDIVSKEGIDKSQFMILRGLMKLRKIAIHPLLEDENYQGASAKFEEVTSHLNLLEMGGRKVLIFSQFLKHLELLKAYFENKSIPYQLLCGKTPVSKREKTIREFDNSKGFHIFLIQLKTGGAGLNLTEADNVIILDPWWNPAVEQQAISRSHRIGQEKPVFATRFITKDTIEEKIMRLQEKKASLAENIIEGGNPLGKISEEELQELFA